MSAMAMGSIPVKGSSSRMKLGREASARAISTRRRSPPDRASAGLFLMLCLSRNGSSAFGEVEPGLFAAGCQNGLGAARGTYTGMMAADLASENSSDALARFNLQELPSRLPPEPFVSLGAKATLRWGEYKAGREL